MPAVPLDGPPSAVSVRTGTPPVPAQSLARGGGGGSNNEAQVAFSEQLIEQSRRFAELIFQSLDGATPSSTSSSSEVTYANPHAARQVTGSRVRPASGEIGAISAKSAADETLNNPEFHELSSEASKSDRLPSTEHTAATHALVEDDVLVVQRYVASFVVVRSCLAADLSRVNA